MPVIQGENFTTIMSSKDMCLIDHLDKFKEAGVDSLKIEGRMKSIYYAAVVTRAYRKMIDSLEGHTIENLEGFREELFKVSHREFSTGFYLGKEEMDEVTKTSYERKYTFLGSVGKQVGPGKFNLIVKNQIRVENELEYIGPDVLFLKDSNYSLFDKDGEKVIKADHGKVYTLETELPLKEGYILRKQT
jgi:putative protease